MARRTVAEFIGKSSGFDKVSKDVDKVSKSSDKLGRQQTRLGQASASAGRQFSAQASGLGGLVAAYAGAAATIFAITAAFDALNRAARAQQTIQGVNALASAIGESGPEILAGLQEITKGQLSIVQTAELANLALSSGFSADQINNLAEISLKASRALGRDLTDSFNRLTRGVVKLEPELLDELGIFTRIEPAAEAFAASIGKTVSQLSQFEKRQAFANAVAEEGSQKFRDIDTTAATSAESLETLAATISNLGITVGGFIANAIQPLATALSQPIAAVGAFGILTKTVFGTTIREARGSLEGFEDTVDDVANGLVDKLGSGSKKAQAATANLSKELSGVSLSTARASAANEQQFKSLIALGRAQELGFRDAKQLQAITKQEISLNEQKIKNLEASGTQTKAQTKQVEILTRRNAALSSIQAAVNARIENTGRASKVAARGVRGVGLALNFAAKAGLGFISILSTIVTVVSLFVTFGSIIAEAFGVLDPIKNTLSEILDFFKRIFNLTAEARQASNAGGSLVESLIGDTGGLTLKGIEEVVANKTTGATVEQEIFQKINTDDLRDAVRQAIIDGAVGTRDEFVKSLIENLNVKDSLQDGFATALFSAFPDLFDNIQNLTEQTLIGIQQFADATGRTVGTVARQVEVLQGGAIRFKNEFGEGALSSLTAQFKTASELNALDDDERKAARELNEANVDRLQTQNVLVNLQEALASGAANIEQIEKRRGAILAKIKNLQNDIEKATGETEKNLKETVAAAQAEFKEVDRNAQAQLAILNARKEIRKTFSAEIAAAGQLSKLFVENAEGRLELIKREKEARPAQIQFLQKSFELGKADLERRRQGAALTGIEAQRAQLAADAQAALSGNLVKSITAARELNTQFEKLKKSQEDRLDILQLELDLEQTRSTIAEDERRAASEAAASGREVAAIKRREKLNKLLAEGANLEMQGQRAALRDALQSTPFLSENRANQIELILRREELKELEELQNIQIEALRKIRLEQEGSLVRQLNDVGAKLGQTFQLDQDGNLVQSTARLEGAANTLSGQFADQLDLENKQIDANRDQKLFEIQQLEERNRLVLQELKGFQDHIDGIARVLAADRVQREEVLSGNFTADAAAEIRKTLLDPDANRDLNKDIRARLSDAGVESTAAADIERADVNTLRSILTDVRASQTQGEVGSSLGKLIDSLEGRDFKTLREGINAVAEKEKELAKARNESAEAAATSAAQEKVLALQGQLTTINEEFNISLVELANALTKAGIDVQNFSKKSDLASDNFRKAALQIDATIENSLVSGLQQLNDALIEGTLTFKNLKEGFSDFAGALIKDIQRIFFTETIAKPAANFLKEAVMGGFGETGTEGGMLGGPVKMATGGMLRDRVPALLEPGEFVIRKPAAKAIGGPALGAMNATGKMPGDVSINIQNEGQPKDAEAQQPRFDGEKFVIDVVLRDLSNNGPIRKSLRAGG